MTTALVALSNGIPTTSSQLVAQTFGKEHKHVLRDIEKVCEQLPENFSQSNFGLANYLDAQGKSRPMYLLTRDAFTLLVMGYTGKEAMQFKLKYIEAFNAMEAELRKQDKPKRKAKAKASPKPALELPPAYDPYSTEPISLNELTALLSTIAYRLDKTCHTCPDEAWKAGSEFFFRGAKANAPDAVKHFAITNALSATLVGPLFITRDLVRQASTMAANAQKMHDLVSSCHTA